MQNHQIDKINSSIRYLDREQEGNRAKNTSECKITNERERMITANNHKKPALHCHSQDIFRRNYSIMKAVSLRLRRGTAEPNMEKKGEIIHTSLP